MGILVAFRIDPTGFQATATARLTAPFIANYAQPTESSITKRDAQPTASTIRNAHVTKRANIFKREVKPTKEANIVKRDVEPTTSAIRNAHITKRANIFKREVKPTKEASIVKRDAESLVNSELSRDKKNNFKIQNLKTIKRVSFLFLNSGKLPK